MRNSLSLAGRIARYQLSRATLRGSLLTLVSLLLVTYVGLVAFTMSYAVVHAQLADAAHDEEARVGQLEARYFDLVAEVNAVDPAALGYQKPAERRFALVPAAPAVADAR
jgi:hypothetical protein